MMIPWSGGFLSLYNPFSLPITYNAILDSDADAGEDLKPLFSIKRKSS